MHACEATGKASPQPRYQHTQPRDCYHYYVGGLRARVTRDKAPITAFLGRRKAYAFRLAVARKSIASVVPHLLEQRQTILSKLFDLSDGHVTQWVADLAVDNSIHDRAIDVVDPAARAFYFARVPESVDIRHALVSVKMDGEMAVPTSRSVYGNGTVNNTADNPNKTWRKV